MPGGGDSQLIGILDLSPPFSTDTLPLIRSNKIILFLCLTAHYEPSGRSIRPQISESIQLLFDHRESALRGSDNILVSDHTFSTDARKSKLWYPLRGEARHHRQRRYAIIRYRRGLREHRRRRPLTVGSKPEECCDQRHPCQW
jgi:hypothetical protein